jgi:tetratricopeptide (TPR) repeat protein
VRRAITNADDEFQDARDRFPSLTDEDEYYLPRRRAGGWIVALFMLLAVGVLTWAVQKRYLAARSASPASAPPVDSRVESFLADGEKALSDGSVDRAQGDFDKASALAERDPRVLLGEARVAAAKADIPWLKLRLLPADANDEMRTTKAQLDDEVATARRAADDALSARPNDARALRAKVDALRLAGQPDAARAYMARFSDQAAQPETAYVLAALDLAQAAQGQPGQAEPVQMWATAIERLRVASDAESTPGRAHAALVYALAKSGDLTRAKTELAKLAGSPRPYALLPNLRAFVDHDVQPPPAAPPAPPAPAASVAAMASAAAAPVSAGAARMQATAAPPPTRGSDAVRPIAHNPAQAAAQAMRDRDFDRARRIYQAVLAGDPSDSEALVGLGDIARSQGDSSGAIAAYRRAIAANPSYLPAHLGLADVEWATGTRASAVRDYGAIADRFPEGTYPAYVKQRAEGSSSSP